MEETCPIYFSCRWAIFWCKCRQTKHGWFGLLASTPRKGLLHFSLTGQGVPTWIHFPACFAAGIPWSHMILRPFFCGWLKPPTYTQSRWNPLAGKARGNSAMSRKCRVSCCSSPGPPSTFTMLIFRASHCGSIISTWSPQIPNLRLSPVHPLFFSCTPCISPPRAPTKLNPPGDDQSRPGVPEMLDELPPEVCESGRPGGPWKPWCHWVWGKNHGESAGNRRSPLIFGGFWG